MLHLEFLLLKTPECKWVSLHVKANKNRETSLYILMSIYRNVVMVPDPRLDISHQDVADQIITSLVDFKPEEWGLPPFEDSN